MSFEWISLEDGAFLKLDPHFLSSAEAQAFFLALRAETPWKAETIRIAGKPIPVPRLTAWHGDPQAVYTYSGLRNEPLVWTPTLLTLRDRISAAAQAPFNAVLLNFYRGGRDSIGWHADNEPELGPMPIIASLSLGARRRFVLRHAKKRAALSIWLEHGSLLIMGGTTQRHYRHALPKTPEAGERINLTFRLVQAPNPDRPGCRMKPD